jgi:Fic family protein
MKLPHTPPPWELILSQVIQDGKFSEFFDFGRTESSRPDRYLHWEEFRHRASPEPGGLSVEQQWAAIRMNRSSRSQVTTMTDAKGRPFAFFLTQKAFQSLHEIDLHCGGGIGVAEDGIVQSQTRDRYYVDSVIEEALTSSQLEGAVVTRSEARDMIRRQRPPATDHERMVLNNYRTMRLLSDLKNQPLSKEVILRIHREVTAGTLDKPEQEGRFRFPDEDVRIEDEESGEIFHIPPPAEDLEKRMSSLCDFANEPGMTGFLHPVIRAIIIHFWIAYDHPFVDGNGRTARALFYWSMLKSGFWLAEFFSISHEILKAPKQYYRAFLYTETDGNDLNYFLNHQLQVICASISSLREYIGKKQAEIDSLRIHLQPKGGFNHRQLALLKHALRHPYTGYTVVSHQTSHGVSNQTAKNDLESLVAKTLLIRGKQGNAFIYTPAQNLATLLEK